MAAPPAIAQAQDDPWEPLNRRIFVVNDAVDRRVFRPVAKGYDRITPRPVRRGIGNVFENLRTPATALNQFLQGKPREGVSDVSRFLLNTTVGLAGFFDVASRSGLAKHEEDFGQTFRTWGVGSGPFMMVPFLGPATTTHAVGMVFDAFTNPLILVSPRRDQLALVAVDLIDTRADLLAVDQLISEDADRYLFIRDAYLQRRQYLISDGQVDDDPFLDDWDDDWDDDDDYDADSEE
ncbi:MAG: VacJ family lipoprotein [Pseudomonadales bacterium]